MNLNMILSVLFGWLLLLMSVIFQRASAAVQNAHACSPPTVASYNCSWFNTTISCADKERILIRDAVYGFRYKHIEICVLMRNGCLKGTDCCPMYYEDDTVAYTASQKYDLYSACAWKQKCSTRTGTGYHMKQMSLYSVVKYECVKETPTVHFCEDASVTGKSVNILFDRQVDNNSNISSGECICQLIPLSDRVRYTVSAPDLRLISAERDCSTAAMISGLGRTNINCSSIFTNRSSSKELLGERELKLSFESRPEFIWIKVDVKDAWTSPVAQIADQNKISVQCYKPEKPTTGSSARVVSTEVPILAIVVPVVLVLSGLAVLLTFIIRYKYKTEKKFVKERSEVIVKSEKGESAQKMKYDYLFSPDGAVKTDDNYIILESDNAYSSINVADMSTNIIPIPTITGEMSHCGAEKDKHLSLSNDRQRVHGYETLIAESVISNEDLYKEKNESDMESVIKDLGQETHMYSVLDPQSLYQKNDMAGLSNKYQPPNGIVANNNAAEEPMEHDLEEETRNYFILENSARGEL